MADYNPQVIERKWQGIWEDAGAFNAEAAPGRPKYYVLEMLPYPSGTLHMGHMRNYTIGDAVARYKRMCGYDVAYLTGNDEHGEKLQRAADAAGVPPSDFVAEKRRQFIEVWKKLGIDYTHFVYTDRPGHVTSVQNGLEGKDGSRLGVQFDQLVQGNSATQLNTVLTSVFSAQGQAQGSDAMAMPAMPTPVAPPAGGGGGGLLGGAGAAVGSTVGSTVGMAGSTLGQAGGAVGATTQNTLGANSNLGLATPVSNIHVGSSASAESSAGASSMLSTRKGNLRLASGTRMQFRVAANSSIQAKK